MKNETIFNQGSCWLRADFHLHTRRDKEFKYEDDDNFFVSNYIKALKNANIQVGVITNHNKFDLKEFNELRKNAQKENIFLLPGVELSVGDGANGIHTLVVFSDEWIENGGDDINPFLTITFNGKRASEYENENGRSSQNLLETIKQLESYHKDFFLIFAHVEDRSGLWNEMKGGRLKEFGESPFFRRRTLGFQKVKTRDEITKVKEWLNSWYPAEVEGSDPKKLEEIGKGKQIFLKIGAFSFEAIKFALKDYQNRVKTEISHYQHSRIESIEFEGAGALGGQKLSFSPELNTLIGVRGSGKSSILEAIRYALNIPLNDVADSTYKEGLVKNLLGSGGKITIQAIDKRGCVYKICRIYGEQPDIYIEGVLRQGISIRETILHQPIYFGQKDLSNSSGDFEKNLIEKLVGTSLSDIRFKIENQRQIVIDTVERFKKSERFYEQKQEWLDKEKDLRYQLSFYQQQGIEEALQKQLDFENDEREFFKIQTQVVQYVDSLHQFIENNEELFKKTSSYQSKHHADFFNDLKISYDQLSKNFETLKNLAIQGRQIQQALQQKENVFLEIKQSAKEEFATIERQLTEKLQQTNNSRLITLDEFRQLRKKLYDVEQMIIALNQNEQQQQLWKDKLIEELVTLNELWLEEYRLIEKKLVNINRPDSPLQIKSEFKGNKSAMLIYLKDMLRGSKIREPTIAKITDNFSDFISVYRELDQVKSLMGNFSPIFEQKFVENLKDLLTYQVPNQFILEYYKKPLQHHSLGQRASALILFVLSQRNHDVVVIDQPEDDLDNQTIYEDVIKLILQLKPQTQFIFATHNANIPVLGDSEKVICCEYQDKKIQFKTGSIDNAEIQEKIVKIMEGGKDAFQRRQEIYNTWKP